METAKPATDPIDARYWAGWTCRGEPYDPRVHGFGVPVTPPPGLVLEPGWTVKGVPYDPTVHGVGIFIDGGVPYDPDPKSPE